MGHCEAYCWTLRVELLLGAHATVGRLKKDGGTAFWCEVGEKTQIRMTGIWVLDVKWLKSTSSKAFRSH
jgi:hypothetical protein